jgi:hypothetical protein
MAFTYGLFIPILFPVTFLGILNMYIAERFCLFYYYQVPPSYDEKLNVKALELLQMAPCGMFILGFWALGNPQIFFNENEEKTFANLEGDSKHRITSLRYGPNHWHLCLVILFFLFFYNFSKKIY